MNTVATRTPRKPGLLIDVARVISVGRDRSTGQAVLRFRDEKGRLVAVRLRPGQFRTLANGVLGGKAPPLVPGGPGLRGTGSGGIGQGEPLEQKYRS